MEKRKRKRELFVDDNKGHETYSSHQRARSAGSRGLQDDVATDLGRLDDAGRMGAGANEKGETDDNILANDFGVNSPGSSTMQALPNTNLDDGVDDSETDTDEPEDENTTTFRMKMIRFKKKFEQLLDEGFCNGVDADLCTEAQEDLDEILDEYVW